MTYLPFLIGGLVFGAAVGYFLESLWKKKQLTLVNEKTKSLLEKAEKEAQEIITQAERKAADILAEAKKEERERKNQITSLENRLLHREEVLDKKINALNIQEAALRKKEEDLKHKEEEIKKAAENIEKQLTKISGLSKEEAKEEIFKKIKEERAQELAQLIQKIEKEKRDELEKRALEIISTALQRYARSHISELTTTTFHLADEDLKGKIIGREGRNIRAIEKATGVELLMDEGPETIVISSFDPFRREVARLALEKLIQDGRIQPAKIEEKVEEAKEELTKRMQEIGEEAANDVGIYDLPKEILQLLGRLYFRTSYGQNVLTHSQEMAHIAGMIAAELGLNVEVAKKAALLHDIGKALDHDIEGTHVEIGRKILKKYGIDEAVIQAMQSHHEDYPYAIPEAYVVTAADILSAARPGARRGTLEAYIKRLADLEKIALEFPGVKNAYALSGGRELRVFVIPEKVDDFRALELAREIANRIQTELKYPGEIKVNVIREIRAVEYAR